MVWIIGAICMIFFGAAARGHRLVPAHVSLCDSGGDIGPGWYIFAGVRSAISGKRAASPLGGWVLCKWDKRLADRSEPFSLFFAMSPFGTTRALSTISPPVTALAIRLVLPKSYPRVAMMQSDHNRTRRRRFASVAPTSGLVGRGPLASPPCHQVGAGLLPPHQQPRTWHR